MFGVFPTACCFFGWFGVSLPLRFPVKGIVAVPAYLSLPPLVKKNSRRRLPPLGLFQRVVDVFFFKNVMRGPNQKEKGCPGWASRYPLFLGPEQPKTVRLIIVPS